MKLELRLAGERTPADLPVDLRYTINADGSSLFQGTHAALTTLPTGDHPLAG